MYQALYRKYRPKDFDDVIGQKIVVQTLKNAIIKQQIVHAYLFTGPRGTGKTSIAKIFAKTINCSNLNGYLPCNTCVSCTQTNNKQNVDIIELDAASNNGVDEIREIKNKVNLVPSISKYKVYIIDEVHMLSTSAFNALLKTLEEPPKHVIFILATTEPQKIPQTILSRCQRFDFKKISVNEIFNRLKMICDKEKICIEEDALMEIARLSDGGMRDSISILDEVRSYNQENITINDVHDVNGTLTQSDLKDFIYDILSGNIEKTFDSLDEFNNSGKNLNKLIDEIIIFLKNVLFFYTVPEYLKKNKIDVTPYMNFKKIIDVNNIYKMINNLNDLSIKMKNSTSPKVLFEVELLKIFENQGKKNISQEINYSPINDKKSNKVIKTDYNEDELNKYNNLINQIKEVRISNALSKFDKKKLLKIKNDILILNQNILDQKYGRVISLILDGQIKAISDEYIVINYTQTSDSCLFNDNLIIIENVLKKFLNLKCKAISVDINEWNIIKDEFNNKKKVYNYCVEQFDFNELYNLKKVVKPQDELSKLFDEIVEYTKEEII